MSYLPLEEDVLQRCAAWALSAPCCPTHRPSYAPCTSPTRPRHVLFARYCLRLVCGGQLGIVIAGQRHCLGVGAQLFTGAPCAIAVTQASDQLMLIGVQ